MSLLLMFSGRCGPDFTQVRPVGRPVEAAEGQTVSGLFQVKELRGKWRRGWSRKRDGCFSP